MEKTKEQKLASKERYLAQEAKAYEMLQTDNLYDYIDGLRYTYSLCMRYKKNLKDFVWTKVDLFKYTNTPLDKCLEAGVLTPWNDTYWFDKTKAEDLQQYILEHPTN
jgi:hypothetical protein